MVRFIFGLVICIFTSSKAQIKSTILDSTTKEPIPYVNIWVEGEDIGATADENGSFELNDTKQGTNLIFSAVGYGEITIAIADIKDKILLAPQSIQLDELVIDHRKKTGKHDIIINSLKNENLIEYNGLPDIGPFMLARYIPYRAEYSMTPFVDKIRFKTRKAHTEMTFNLRLYSVNPEDGSPGDVIYNENILMTLKAKKEYHIADLSHLNITIPPEGLFVVAEFFIIEKNICSSVYNRVTDEQGKILPEKEREFLYNLYGPEFVHERKDTPDEGWMYKNGKWQKNTNTFKGKYGVLAAEVTLTD
jgi:hypothetical protein